MDNEKLETEMERVYGFLGTISPASQEYGNAVKNLSILSTQRVVPVVEVQPEKRQLVDWNTVIVCGTNILGIVLMLNYESLHNVTSKAISFIVKPKF